MEKHKQLLQVMKERDKAASNPNLKFSGLVHFYIKISLIFLLYTSLLLLKMELCPW